MERYALIMAGGAGLRLWPLSREGRPKQFICAGGSENMLLQTIKRLLETVKAQNCFIITGGNLLDATRETVKQLLPLSNILAEPERKNTAACIATAAYYLQARFGEGLLCCVPADGYVKDTNSYREAVERAYDTAETYDSLVIIGIVPTAPATGYGYIQLGSQQQEDIFQVNRFIEKPDAQKASQMLSSGEYLWNSGIVAGKLDVITNNIRLYLPGHFEKISGALQEAPDADRMDRLQAAYRELADVSFDIGVLEKCGRIFAVKGRFDWDDIGNLDSLSKAMEPDTNGNSVSGRHIGVDTSGSVIYSTDALVATLGIHDMIVACSKDALIVCPRNRAQEVKALVQKLKQNGFEEFT